MGDVQEAAADGSDVGGAVVAGEVDAMGFGEVGVGVAVVVDAEAGVVVGGGYEGLTESVFREGVSWAHVCGWKDVGGLRHGA